VRFVFQYFGRDVVGCAALLRQVVAVSDARKPEIHQLQVRVVFCTRHKQVLRLEVPVRDVVVVTVLDGAQQHLGQLPGFCFVVELLGHDAIEQLSARYLL